MVIRSLARAVTPPLLLFLLLLSVTCSYGDQNQEFINSCGDIHNITFPFQLQGDPSHNAYDQYFALTCDENNRAVLNLLSGKYYVQSINYNTHSIRIVDVGIQTNDICSSFPLSSLTRTDFDSGVGPYRTSSWSRSTAVVLFLSCERPIQSPLYINTNGNCITGDEPGNGYYSYVVVKDVSIQDFPDSCFLDQVTGSSSPRLISTGGWNLSWLDLNRELAYGFELSWSDQLTRVCEICKKTWVFTIPGMPESTLTTICGDCQLELSFSSLLWLKIKSNQTLLLSIIGGILGARLLCAPFVFGFLVPKFNKRNLSAFDSIEGFLRSENHLVPIRYSYSDIKKMTNGFRDKLGEGGYGSVYKGKLQSGPFVAIKMLSKPKADGQEFINEVATIGRIHHVNIVKLVGYCAERSKRALVYDFMPNGSLEKYIFSSEEELSLSCKQIYEISLGVARGIGYLHQGCDMQILHFDIKPHNILLDENFTAKVSDFGLAKLYPTDDKIVTVTAARGTLGYIAPELFYKNIGSISYKADIYSFGMLLMEMAGRRRNWNSSVDSSQIYFPSWVYDQFAEGKNIQIGETTEEENEMVKKMMLVSLWCIQMSPSDRPNSMNKVVEMLEGNIQLLEMPPKPFQYSQLAMQAENGINRRSSNLSGACMDSLTRDISGR